MSSSFGKKQPVGAASFIPSSRKPTEEGSERFMRITARYVAVCGGMLALQLVPVIGSYLKILLFGAFWLGIIVNLYFAHIIVERAAWRIPRWCVALPILYFGGGICAGLYSDVMTSRWTSKQQWLNIERAVPTNVQYLAFEPFNLIANNNLEDGSTVHSERFGFQLIRVMRDPTNRRNFDRLVVASYARPHCTQAGRDAWQIADRCYRLESMWAPPSWLVIGEKLNEETQQSSLLHSWGRVYPTKRAVAVHTQDRKDIVGSLSGAVIRKHSYYPFPFIVCDSERARWKCEWSLLAPWGRRVGAGFAPGSSAAGPDTAPLLMSALEQLRGVGTR